MDRRRSWPWKRKLSEKASSDSDFAGAGLYSTEVKQGEQELTKPVSFIQISLDKYEHFNVLEEQVEVLNVKLNDMKEKLTSAQTDITTKEDLVKQHAKVAEEAISGWEKAETEASDLKQKLESVTLLKLAAEEQAARLDIELKECMKQNRTEKEENEKKLHDVVFAETKLWEKVKSEFEATIADFEQELLKGSAEIDALSRSLQERSVLLMKFSEEKSQADAEIEILKTNVESYEKEVSSLKHELNIAARELQICNEEKNMSVKAAEVANKQHIEDVKKITKLEAECQRLRSLVRKRLPGPAALAQMKLEVESLGHDFGESRLRRLTGKGSNKHSFSSPEVKVNEVEHYQKENEFLTTRLLAMEEESKMLKEDLSKKDSELQTLSSRCAKKANKLHILKAHMLAVNQQKSSLKSKADISFKGSLSQHERNHSLASISEDGIDDQGNCAESWASALITQLSQLTKERHSDRSKKTQYSNQLELMDDYLEMERLAGLSSENVVVSFSDAGMDVVKNENSDDISSVDVHMDVCKEQTSSLKQHQNLDLVAETQPSGKLLSMIGALIYFVFDSKLLDSRMGVLVDEIVKILQVAQNEWPLHSRDRRNAEACCSIEVTHHYETSITHHGNLYMELENSMNQHLRSAISWIHEFVILLHKEVTQGHSSELQATREKVEEFSDSANKLLYTNLNIDSFILSLRHFFSKTKELRSRTWVTEENCCSDCIDKVTLLENGVARRDSREGKIPGDQNILSPLISGLEVVKGPSNPSSESEAEPHSFSSEKFEKLKMERDDMEVNLINCTETLENTKFQLTEIELNLAELKRQLSASQKSNDLADTQLRCMTESYKLLESREDELKAEINLLRSKAKAFESELIAERHCHQNDLAKYNGLQDQMSNMSCTKCSCHSEADAVAKARRDREIAAAADKIAECQETIILLNKQLNSLHHPVEPTSKNSRFREEPSLVSYISQQAHYPAIESDAVSSSVNQVESPQPEFSSQFSSSEMESSPTPKSTASTKNPKPRPRSTSDSSLSSMLNDKPGRGFSRFFSKGKGEL